jgi:hypothetical protein
MAFPLNHETLYTRDFSQSSNVFASLSLYLFRETTPVAVASL